VPVEYASKRSRLSIKFYKLLIYLAPLDGLFGASRLTLRVALKGDRRRCAASSNRYCLMSAVRITIDWL
jgi:hypothetical protein